MLAELHSGPDVVVAVEPDQARVVGPDVLRLGRLCASADSQSSLVCTSAGEHRPTASILPTILAHLQARAAISWGWGYARETWVIKVRAERHNRGLQHSQSDTARATRPAAQPKQHKGQAAPHLQSQRACQAHPSLLDDGVVQLDAGNQEVAEHVLPLAVVVSGDVYVETLRSSKQPILRTAIALAAVLRLLTTEHDGRAGMCCAQAQAPSRRWGPTHKQQDVQNTGRSKRLCVHTRRPAGREQRAGATSPLKPAPLLNTAEHPLRPTDRGPASSHLQCRPGRRPTGELAVCACRMCSALSWELTTHALSVAKRGSSTACTTLLAQNASCSCSTSRPALPARTHQS